MSICWQIPRNCLAWILLSQGALVAAHAQRLPWWVIAVYAVCALWRIMVYRGRWSLPPKPVKVILALCCFIGIFRSYGSVVGLEPTVALLFSGFSLKLLEISNKRDVYVFIFLAYFAALTAFLFSQDFSVAVVIFLTLLLITSALVALHQQGYDQFNSISLRKSSVIFLQAVPLMLLLFIVFPRFEPFWSVPLASHQAKTGMSDTMGPGDISNLSQSDKLAFRVDFDGNIPQQQTLYWRGLVLSKFDGRRWQQGRWKQELLSRQQADAVRTSLKNPIEYTVIQEPTFQPWLFSLALAYSDEAEIKMMADYRLVRVEDVHSRISYSVRSDQQAKIEPWLSQREQNFETSLPPGVNPRSRQFARQLWLDSQGQQDFIGRVLSLFRQQAFFYTLKPPLLGRHSVDEFLFESKKGFCEHYASSFVFLMRAAGVPARVVVGYQGGEVNPITGSVLVHQFDAHAWAEVWLDGQGWLRVDPTAAVSPLRIEFGLERAMEQEQGEFLSGSPLSPLRYRNIEWLNQLRLQMDAFSYYWSSWVLGYEGARQLTVLKRLLGEITPWRIASLLIAVGAVVLALVAVSLLRGRGKKKSSPAIRLYLRLCKRLEASGFKRLPHEGPIDFARRVAEQQPRWKQHLLTATRAFITLNYESLPPEQKAALIKQLRREIFKITYQLR